MDSLVTMKQTTNNPPPSNNSSSCESDNSVEQFLPTINALKERQGINNKNKESRQSVKPSNSADRNKCKKPTQNTNIKSPFFYHRTRHRQSPNLVEWQNHLQLVYSRTRSSAPMNHQLIPKPYPRPLMDIQCYPVKPLPMKPRRKLLLLLDSHTDINPTQSIPTLITQRYPIASRRNQSVNWDNLVKIHVGTSNSSYITNLSRGRPTPKLPGFYLINARSLFPKIDELSLLLNTYPLDVVAIIESWLTDDIIDELVLIDGYKTFRKDRVHGRGCNSILDSAK